MSATAADAPAFGFVKINGTRMPKLFELGGTFTTGALVVDQRSDSALTISGAAGTYALTFPACPSGSKALIDISFVAALASAATNARITTINPTAGTATLVTYQGTPGTPVTPVDGDSLRLQFWLDTQSDR